MSQLSIQDQYDKMLQERNALHQEVMELQKAEPLVQCGVKVLQYIQTKPDPLLNPVENEWVYGALAPNGC